MRRICLLPEEISSISSLKSTYFPLSLVDCFYSMYFIIGVINQSINQSSDRENPTVAAFAAVLNMSSSGHVDK